MAQSQQPAQLCVPSLTFPTLARSSVTVTVSERTAQFQAIADLPAAKFRIFNASSLKNLALRSDSPVQNNLTASGMTLQDGPNGISTAPPTGVPLNSNFNGTNATYSPMNTKRFVVSLTSDDVRTNASLQDVSS